MDTCPERLLGLRDTSGEGDESVAACCASDGETLTGEPRGNLGDVLRAEAKLCAELLRRKPLVIAGRVRVLLIDEQLVQRGLLGGCHIEIDCKRIKHLVG